MPAKTKSSVPNLALSVRQPLAEKIMLGIKKIEYRSIPTNIRGRVYIYASKTPNLEVYRKMKKVPGDFPVGVLVGTVEITDCKEKPDQYLWILDKPKRLKRPLKPDKHPQPVWFKPFEE
jgi:hypothetical protein